MEGERGMGAERAVLIFLLKVAILFPLLARVGLPTQYTWLEVRQLAAYELWAMLIGVCSR
jgi:hypothetical protein